ncbi:MAG: TrkA family potassium uptake protein [bacterium]|nr:TrkA family potassium uptake protein [bacterium]
MQKKEFVVFGLGRFGGSVAKALAESGSEVLVVDKDEEKIQELADIVTYAVQADVCDSETIASLGIGNYDAAIVAIGQSLEASVMITILAKELGVPFVLAKARNEIHAKVLKKVGADRIVFPEKETGIRIANNLVQGNLFNATELSETTSIMEVDVPASWGGHSLRELNLRQSYKVNVIGLKHNGKVDINMDPDELLTENDTLVVIGNNEVLNKLASQKSSL